MAPIVVLVLVLLVVVVLRRASCRGQVLPARALPCVLGEAA